MGKKHQDGAKTGKQGQSAGRHRGPETGTGYTGGARGRPDQVVSSDPSAPKGTHRILGFLWTRKGK
jgi:hypothetical protein